MLSLARPAARGSKRFTGWCRGWLGCAELTGDTTCGRMLTVVSSASCCGTVVRMYSSNSSASERITRGASSGDDPVGLEDTRDGKGKPRSLRLPMAARGPAAAGAMGPQAVTYVCVSLALIMYGPPTSVCTAMDSKKPLREESGGRENMFGKLVEDSCNRNAVDRVYVVDAATNEKSEKRDSSSRNSVMCVTSSSLSSNSSKKSILPRLCPLRIRDGWLAGLRKLNSNGATMLDRRSSYSSLASVRGVYSPKASDDTVVLRESRLDSVLAPVAAGVTNTSLAGKKLISLFVVVTDRWRDDEPR
eukprot:PhM_4_TR3424/c0_g1_i1/m.536